MSFNFNKLLLGTCAASAVIAGLCNVSQKLNKVKEVATGVGVAAAALFLFINVGGSAQAATPASSIPRIAPMALSQYPSYAPQSLIDPVVQHTPSFSGYAIDQGRRTLTSMHVRPANLFFNALLGDNCTTMPGSRYLFSFRVPHDHIRRTIEQGARDPQAFVSFSASTQPQLASVYGNATYRISCQELLATLDSQKIYVSPHLPLPFYQALKSAMLQDQMVTLPGRDKTPMQAKNMPGKACSALINAVRQRPTSYGFNDAQHCKKILDLTLYQLGSMVVKTEDYRIFMDANGRILERNPGQNDAIRLINACGIRGIHHTPNQAVNREIMVNTFRTSLVAAENGMIVFPAVGMGIWGGDPDLYWRAFLDAVIASGNQVEKIYINPNHQKTQHGRYAGRGGDEFQEILNEYKKLYPHNANLNKIINLSHQKTDVVQLAYNLKQAYPHKIISLFNASDPDVTLGNHVGEYVNNLNHASTTEENYTAMGTNGLCFEAITNVHRWVNRVVQVFL